MIRLHTALLLEQSLLGLRLVGLQLAVPCFQLGHLGLELCHPSDGGAPLGQLLGSLLRQLHQSLENNLALQHDTYKNKSATPRARQKIYLDQPLGELGGRHELAGDSDVSLLVFVLLGLLLRQWGPDPLGGLGPGPLRLNG